MSDEKTQETTIRWMNEVSIEDLPKKAVDPLAAEVLRRFNGAVAWQSAELVNGKPLRTVLEQCWMQQNGIMSADAKERAEELGTNVYVNLTALKADVANAYLNDALTSSGNSSLPWVIQPTPRPDISPVAQDEVFVRIRSMIEQQAFNEDPAALVDAIRQAKREMFEQESEKAEKSGITDQPPRSFIYEPRRHLPGKPFYIKVRTQAFQHVCKKADISVKGKFREIFRTGGIFFLHPCTPDNLQLMEFY